MSNENYDVLKLNVNRANPEDCIREGILSKYSNKQKKFVERMVLLYKDQLLITKIKENANVKVMLLSDIASVKKGSEERKLNGRYMFQIRTKENDITVFNSNNMTDMECWINTILNQVNIIRENMFFVCYSKDMNEMIKSVYRDSMIIITNQLNTLNGVLSIKESRSLFLKHLNNPLLASLINDIINYQISVSESNYQSAKRAFISFSKSLLIEEYNLAIYFEDDHTNQNQSTIRNENSIEKTTILYQNINIETRLIGIKEMNLPLLIKSVMPYKTIFQFKEIINELKNIPDSQYKLLSQHLKPHLFNEVFDKIVKILKISFKEINSNRSFIIGIETLLWYYSQKRDAFTKSKLMTFDVLCIK